MRNFAIIAVLSFSSLLMSAPATISVEQLRSLLSARAAAKDADEKVAQQLSALELNQRLTVKTREALISEFRAGPNTTMALDLLADASALLDPPDAELPDKPAPDAAAMQSMMNAAVSFVAVTLHRLPNFLATRTTRSFDDSPLVVTHSGWAPGHTAFHLAGTFRQEITYRDGRETGGRSVAVSAANAKQGASPPGLTSSGEFGPILGTVLKDSSKGKVAWSHWESAQTGPAAVFHYSVPKPASHYAVDFCCVRGTEDTASYGGIGSGATTNSFHGTPAYHGSLFIDPATGAILRITLDAELDKDGPLTQSAIAIDYGEVEIGSARYICPVRSVAISSASTHLGGDMGDRTIRRINEVRFTDYHRFGTSMRIVSDSQAK